MTKVVVSRVQELLDTERKFDALFNGCPIPMWFKVERSGQFVMQDVNDAYTDALGISKEAYVGQTDFELWEDKKARVFYANDQYVTKRRHMIMVEEKIVNPGTSKKEIAVGWKWPQINDGEVEGVWGCAYVLDRVFWYTVRSEHQFYKNSSEFLDIRWRELYQQDPPQ